MFCSIETCRNALRRALVEPYGSARPAPRFRPSVATPSRSRRPAISRESAASIGYGPHANAWSAHASYSGTSDVTKPRRPSEPSSVATMYSTSSGRRFEG
jgi:hypothetical protein